MLTAKNSRVSPYIIYTKKDIAHMCAFSAFIGLLIYTYIIFTFAYFLFRFLYPVVISPCSFDCKGKVLIQEVQKQWYWKEAMVSIRGLAVEINVIFTNTKLVSIHRTHYENTSAIISISHLALLFVERKINISNLLFARCFVQTKETVILLYVFVA